MPGAGVMNIAAYGKRLAAREPMNEQTPPQVADRLDSEAAEALRLVDELRPTAKVRGATELAQYQPQLLTRIGYVDWNAITASMAKDIEIARAW